MEPGNCRGTKRKRNNLVLLGTEGQKTHDQCICQAKEYSPKCQKQQTRAQGGIFRGKQETGTCSSWNLPSVSQKNNSPKWLLIKVTWSTLKEPHFQTLLKSCWIRIRLCMQLSLLPPWQSFHLFTVKISVNDGNRHFLRISLLFSNQGHLNFSLEYFSFHKIAIKTGRLPHNEREDN